MKLGTRIFIAFLLISIVCFYYPINRIVKDLRMFFIESVEDSIADQANVLAAMIGAEMEEKRFKPDKLYKIFRDVYSRSLSAKIYDFGKTHVDLGVYITDTSGKVIFDSTDKKNIGADYSGWRDVALALKGEYGARTTHIETEGRSTAILYVAAPIIVHGETAGVLTVVKPTTNINTFLGMARPRVLKIWYLSAAFAILLAFIVSIWITQPIKRLTRYANDVRAGKRVKLPRMGRGELRDMGMALENMREALEGKKYVEEYIHTLTHEIKSPLSAIRGAAELLDEGMPPDRRARFLANIRSESGRIQDIVDHMLELSELEAKKTLQKVESLSVSALIKTVLESKEPMLSGKRLDVIVNAGDDMKIKGEPFLLHQALSNIIQNAIDFSPAGGRIEVAAHVSDKRLFIVVSDEGPGIPDYSMEKVFDRFFSLQRPDTGKKSTGLGLNFVKEVANLHNGSITLENLPEKGLRATLALPV